MSEDLGPLQHLSPRSLKPMLKSVVATEASNVDRRAWRVAKKEQAKQQKELIHRRECAPLDNTGLERLYSNAPPCDPLITTEMNNCVRQKHAALAETMLPLKQMLESSECLVPSLWGIVLQYVPLTA
jgi:hypothetical protein